MAGDGNLMQLLLCCKHPEQVVSPTLGYEEFVTKEKNPNAGSGALCSRPWPALGWELGPCSGPGTEKLRLETELPARPVPVLLKTWGAAEGGTADSTVMGTDSRREASPKAEVSNNHI